jgi:hypothetical protein
MAIEQEPFKIKQGATSPNYEAQLRQDVGQMNERAIDLTNADTVFFVMRSLDGDAVIDSEVLITDTENGWVAYDWTAGDTDEKGRYKVEFRIEWTNGKIEKVPNDTYREMFILESRDS